jgi:hypothetical protein
MSCDDARDPESKLIRIFVSHTGVLVRMAPDLPLQLSRTGLRILSMKSAEPAVTVVARVQVRKSRKSRNEALANLNTSSKPIAFKVVMPASKHIRGVAYLSRYKYSTVKRRTLSKIRYMKR